MVSNMQRMTLLHFFIFIYFNIWTKNHTDSNKRKIKCCNKKARSKTSGFFVY
jgi:hypothetical protein